MVLWKVMLSSYFNFWFLSDFIGHIKLVNKQIPDENLVLDEDEIGSTRMILIHVQTHE